MKASLVALIIALLPSFALACGLPLEARITAERALIVYDGAREQITTTVDLAEGQPGAAVVFPLPGPAEVDQPAGGEELFAYLDGATRPQIREETRLVWEEGATAGGAPEGVHVLGRETLGGYDVARLAADDAQALQRWLDENGYELPTEASSILASYIAQGWSFVAVKLAGEADGSLAPLRMSFPAQEIVYPMRLGALSDRPVAVDLYVLAEHRTALDALETRYAGPLTALDPAPPAALAGLLAGAPYLTRLSAAALDPTTLKEDFVIARAPNDEAFRAIETVQRPVPVRGSIALIGAFVCLILLSIFAVVGSVALRRRIDSIQ